MQYIICVPGTILYKRFFFLFFFILIIYVTTIYYINTFNFLDFRACYIFHFSQEINFTPARYNNDDDVGDIIKPAYITFIIIIIIIRRI